jgi:hypothetical protein
MTDVPWTMGSHAPKLAGRPATRKEPAVLHATPHRSIALFTAVVVAQLLDLATFLPAVARVGIGAESNPVARTLYLSMGPVGPVVLKAAAVTIMVIALVRVVQRFPAFAIPSAALIVGIGLFGTASNVLFGLLR